MSLIDETLIYAYDQKPTDKPVLSLHIKLEMVIPPKEKIEIDDYEVVNHLKSKFNGNYVAKMFSK